jgi:hypothetical protein
MTRNRAQCTAPRQPAQIADRTVTREREHIGVLRSEGRGVADTAEKYAGRSDPMTLLNQALDQSLSLAGPLSPHNLISGPNYSGEIKIVRIKFSRHSRFRLGTAPHQSRTKFAGSPP